MWSRDFLRVLQGAGKVAEQISRTQGPDVATATNRLTKHAAELARLGPYLFESTSNVQHVHGAEAASEQQFQQQYEAPPAAYTPPAAAPASPATPEFTQDTVVQREAQAAAHMEKDLASKLPSGAAFEEVIEYKEPMQSSAPPAAEPKSVFQTVQDVLKHQHPLQHQQPQQVPPPPVMPAPFTQEEQPNRAWKEKHVPSSPLSRILGFGSLAAKLAVGTATEIVRSGGKGGTYSALISDSNVEKLAETLCTMRGAALKLGQMLSIQDENMIPSKLADALDRVRQK